MAEIRDARLITKRTSVPGKIPTGTTGNELNFIKSGELASNLSDHSLWGFDGANVFEYGSSSFLGLTGGTVSGSVFISGGLSATTLSGGTIFSGGTNLYDIFAQPNQSPYKTYILTAGTSYSFTGTVNTVSIFKTTGSATHVNLPSNPIVNNFYIVKDRKGDSTSHPITVSGGTYTIDGSTSIEIKKNNKPSFTFLFDGSEYIII